MNEEVSSMNARYKHRPSWRHAERPVLRLFVLIVCPILLLATFVTMEIALVADTSGYEPGYAEWLRKFIYHTLFVPFFLGVLVGHWYHPWPERKLSGRQFGIRTAIVVSAALVLGLIFGLPAIWLSWVEFPYWVNSLVAIAGAVFGAWSWPVRVYSSI
jgi:hypothetical protein